MERHRLTPGGARDYGIIRLDAIGRIVAWSSDAERITGYSESEAAGQHIGILYPPEDVESGVPEFQLRLASLDGLFHEEAWRVRKDGGRYWAESLIYAVCETLSNRPEFAMMVRDITDRKMADEQLRKLWRAVEQSPTSVVITDVAGAIEYVNPKFTWLTGYSLQEALGQNPRILKSEITPSGSYVDMWNTILAGEEWRGEFCNKKKNGDLYWEYASISPVRSAEGVITHFVAVKEDITERKRTDEQIRKLNRELEERAEQLEAVNAELAAFSYSVSHDLRAPLRRIDGFSRALQEDFSDVVGAEGANYLSRLRASVSGMSQLIEDMLRLSRVTSGEMHRETVDMSGIAEAVIDDLRRASPGRTVETVVQPEMTAQGDARLLRIAVENLIGNAWKFSSNQDNARVEFGSTAGEDGPVFFVRDNGVGFDMAYAEKLFGAFQRLHAEAEFPGTGIGLATALRVVRRHGGRIWAQGEVGQGATFFFTL